MLPQTAPQSGWWLARVGDGKVGLVPGTYVQRTGPAAAASRPGPAASAAPARAAPAAEGTIAKVLADFHAEDQSEPHAGAPNADAGPVSTPSVREQKRMVEQMRGAGTLALGVAA